MRLINIAFFCTIIYLAGCAVLPAGQSISTPSATHSYVLSGTGNPTVIFETGLGDGKESWLPIYQQVGKFTQVFAYDRAGYGHSRSANSKRDGATIIRELRSSLKALQIQPPFVLVGHSIGGTYMELYARKYPDEVAGVVLVDARHADFTQQCTLAGARSCKPNALLSALLPSTSKQELKDGNRTMNQVRSGGEFPDVPLAVLVGMRKPVEGKRFREVWLKTQKSLAAMSEQSSLNICNNCGHYIHRDKPELVVSAVKNIVTQARNGLSTDPRGRQ